ncbi:hypothetical protein HPB50_016509 [Hyalomma asiaticum]|uniref:Uncharacterized protein n=1 Tax=Hyalomma asiaticum TaxID=266040 RepID=A0ACB7SZ84_HYAAI|nr:hypothetical protein HPB50_016509 [Hyalomma asiaticum]
MHRTPAESRRGHSSFGATTKAREGERSSGGAIGIDDDANEPGRGHSASRCVHARTRKHVYGRNSDAGNHLRGISAALHAEEAKKDRGPRPLEAYGDGPRHVRATSISNPVSVFNYGQCQRN